jgi:4-amino-4-deoxy-L-arabinose transferase-like glycosyltransferase
MKHLRILLLPVAIAILLTIPWLNRPFFSRGEPREALVAQSMLATGNWISPPAYDGAVPSKPPLTHWLMAIASLPGGEVTEATSRLPAALAFIIFTAAFTAFVTKRTSVEFGSTAALILLTSSEWFRAALSCRVDTVLATALAGGLLSLFSWQERDRTGWPVLAIVLLSIATLSKGPIGLALPGLIFALYLLTTGRVRREDFLRLLLDGLRIVLPVLTISSLWYLAAYLQRGDEFLNRFWYENVQRFAGTMEDEPHNHWFPYLWGLTFVGVLPWGVLWIMQLFFSGRTLPRTVSDGARWWRSLSPLLQFSFVASAVTILFFSIPSSKRSVYVLPAYPFIAILGAGLLDRMLQKTTRVAEWLIKVCYGLAFISIGVALVLLVGALFTPSDSAFSLAWSALRASTVGWFTILSLAAALGFYALAKSQGYVSSSGGEAPVSWRMGEAVALTATAVNFFLVGAVAHLLSPKEWLLAPHFQKALASTNSSRFYSFGSEDYSASFYLKKPFFRIKESAPLEGEVFVEERNQEALSKLTRAGISEVARFASILEAKKKATVLVKINPDR